MTDFGHEELLHFWAEAGYRNWFGRSDAFDAQCRERVLLGQQHADAFSVDLLQHLKHLLDHQRREAADRATHPAPPHPQHHLTRNASARAARRVSASGIRD